MIRNLAAQRKTMTQKNSRLNKPWPPPQTQFRKGESRNPSGRPKKARRLTQDILIEKLSKMVPTVENGTMRKLTARQAMIRARVEQGLKGNVNAIAFVLRLARGTGQEKPEVIFEITGLYGPDD